MPRTRIAAAALLAALQLPVSASAAGGCEGLTAALVKGLSTPWHATITASVGTPKSVEVVTIGATTYVRELGGDWRVRKVGPDATVAKVRKDWAASTCIAAGTEELDGAPADIVTHHASGEPGESSDTRFWISQASGLVLKSELKAQRQTVTTVYDYRDVKAPVAP